MPNYFKYLLISLSFFICIQCKKEVKSETKIDTQKILQAAVNAYGEGFSFYFADSLISTPRERDFLQNFKEIVDSNLNLTGRIYYWCKGCCCYERILYLKRDSFEYAFPFTDNELFYGYYYENEPDRLDTIEYLKSQEFAQDDIFLDDQLSFIAGKLGYQTDTSQFNQLITIVVDSLLEMEEINLEEAILLKQEFNSESIPDHISIKKRCLASFGNTINKVIQGFQNGKRYFWGNAFGGKNAGIWEFQLKSISEPWTKKKGQFYLQIQVLNYECIERPIII